MVGGMPWVCARGYTSAAKERSGQYEIGWLASTPSKEHLLVAFAWEVPGLRTTRNSWPVGCRKEDLSPGAVPSDASFGTVSATERLEKADRRLGNGGSSLNSAAVIDFPLRTLNIYRRTQTHFHL